MARYGIDAVTLLQVVRDGRAVAPEHRLVAPGSLRSQVLELLLTEVRAGGLTDREALRLHTAVTEVKVRLLADRVSRAVAFELARAHDWPTLRDAEVLAVTRLQADALVTVDAALAARAEGVVPLVALADVLAG